VWEEKLAVYRGHYHLMYAEPYSDVHYKTFKTKNPGSFDHKKKKKREPLSLPVGRCLDTFVGVSCLSAQPPAERERGVVRSVVVTVMLPVCFIQ
jgi:hypothetical protein